MKTFLQNFVLVLVPFACLTPSVYANHLDNVGGSSTSTSIAAPATVPAGSQKPTAPILMHCAKNYGHVALELPLSQVLAATFARVGTSAALVAPLVQHASKQDGCFTLVERGALDARLKLRVEVLPPTISNSSSVGKARALNAIPLFDAFPANKDMRAKQKFFSEAQVLLTIVDAGSGKTLASVTGTANSTDVGLGVALLANSSGPLAGAPNQNLSIQVIATELADAFNKLVPEMDKLNVAPSALNVSIHQPGKSHQ